MAVVPLRELEEATHDDLAGLTLEDVRRRLREQARWKIDCCERAAVMMMQGRPHVEIRERLGVTAAQYRHVRRWLRMAMLSEVRVELVDRSTGDRFTAG